MCKNYTIYNGNIYNFIYDFIKINTFIPNCINVSFY